MKIRLLLVGRTERGFVSEGLAHYLERVKHSTPVEVLVLSEAGTGNAAQQARMEEPRILAALQPGERVVLLDERGRNLTSPQFAAHLGAWRDQSVRQVTFVIGGAYGVTEAVRQRADLVLSLSAMTFPHQLVRLLFAEQLYRAYAILGGRPYHH
ncbi:MAG: 23S rRNA (pseudouridine(1915)-N(3))-methyltransferase RlmH [Flavobacteriales bacterium]|nr:23S rRNA (pseudouridine(1915)-N(3))-methyltransferase RlmH [Flavobacteriales bacterium]